MKNPAILIVALAAIFIIASNSFFTVNQVEQALVLEFGEIKRVEKEAGLKFKVPFTQNVIKFDNRLLEFHAKPTEVITKDKETRVVIDAFVLYRIINPVSFYQAVRNESTLNSRLNSIVEANMRKILAKHYLDELLSEKRAGIMAEIKKVVNLQTSETARTRNTANKNTGFGIEVIDVRIMRADLPDNVSQATYERMRKNFTKEAQKFRAEGEELAVKIRSNAEKDREIILANAKKDSEITRGEGDAKASKIYADAFNKDPKFFEFYRTMQAYKKTLNKSDTTVILSPNSKFLRLLDR